MWIEVKYQVILKNRANPCCLQYYCDTCTLAEELFPWQTLYKADFAIYPQYEEQICLLTFKTNKDQGCRLKGDPGRLSESSGENHNSEMFSELWYLDFVGSLPLQLLRNHSCFFGLCPDRVCCCLSAHVLFASLSFYTLYPASHVCTNSHPSIPLFYFSILYIHVSSFLLSLIFCSPSQFPATTEESLGWWTTAGAGIHIYVSCPCWLSYNSHNNTGGTWVLYKHPTLAAVSATCEEWVDFRLFSCIPLY